MSRGQVRSSRSVKLDEHRERSCIVVFERHETLHLLEHSGSQYNIQHNS